MATACSPHQPIRTVDRPQGARAGDRAAGSRKAGPVGKQGRAHLDSVVHDDGQRHVAGGAAARARRRPAPQPQHRAQALDLGPAVQALGACGGGQGRSGAAQVQRTWAASAQVRQQHSALPGTRNGSAACQPALARWRPTSAAPASPATRTLVQRDHPALRVQHPPRLERVAALRGGADVGLEAELGGGRPGGRGAHGVAGAGASARARRVGTAAVRVGPRPRLALGRRSGGGATGRAAGAPPAPAHW